jgi:prepilin-type N-terminal cleavage/methylation domain-containing protein
MSATGRSDARGFTLIEMLVVLAVMGLVSGIAFPAVERSIAHMQFRLAAADIEAGLRAARAAAIAGGAPVAYVAASPGGNAEVELPRGGLEFYPDGSASGGTVSVTGAKRVVRFAIDGATGIVRQLP